MSDSYSWTTTSPVTSYGSCYGPVTTTNYSAQSFYAAARSRCAAHFACAADDRLPVISSRDEYFSQLPPQQQQQQQQQLGWFSVHNMVIPLNVGTTPTSAVATTYLDSRHDDDVTETGALPKYSITVSVMSIRSKQER